MLFSLKTSFYSIMSQSPVRILPLFLVLILFLPTSPFLLPPPSSHPPLTYPKTTSSLPAGGWGKKAKDYSDAEFSNERGLESKPVESYELQQQVRRIGA